MYEYKKTQSLKLFLEIMHIYCLYSLELNIYARGVLI